MRKLRETRLRLLCCCGRHQTVSRLRNERDVRDFCLCGAVCSIWDTPFLESEAFTWKSPDSGFRWCRGLTTVLRIIIDRLLGGV